MVTSSPSKFQEAMASGSKQQQQGRPKKGQGQRQKQSPPAPQTPKQQKHQMQPAQHAPGRPGGGGGGAGRGGRGPATPSRPQQQQQQQRGFKTPTPKKSASFPSMASMSSSPTAFAGSKCYEPPTPQSLPRPPSAWVTPAKSGLAAPQSKSSPFQDLVSAMLKEEERGESRDVGNRVRQQSTSSSNGSDGGASAAGDDPDSRHLRFLLKVQA